MKKLIFWALILFWLSFSQAQDSPSLIPEADVWKVQQTIQKVKDPNWDFIDNYNKAASWADLSTQMATGVMNRDTPISFLAYLVRVIMQIAMVIWALMIIYAGYIYASWVFSWNVTKWPTAIKSAIIWILIIAFSYLIIRILTAMFIS